MNQFFYETRGKEKIKDLLREGQRNQAFHVSRAPKHRLHNGLPRFGVILLGILGALALLIH